MNKPQKKALYISIVIILVLTAFILYFSFRGYTRYSVWKGYQDYFSQPYPKIESWMTIRMISSKFDITRVELLREMSANETQINQHMTLDRFCRQYRQNCTDLVERLNTLTGK